MTPANINSKENKETYFNERFFPYLSQLYNYGYYLTKDEDDANDLVQDTFVKAFRFIDIFLEGTNEKAWLFKIMKNGFINEYRRKSNRPTHYSYDTVIETSEETSNGDISIVMNNSQSDSSENYIGLMGDEVTRALEMLPNDYRQILVLADIEEFSYEELSDILDIPIGTVRSRLFRARNLLKDKLRNYGKNLGYKDKREK